MAYRNTIISIASVVALGTACSKAPSYNSGVQTGAVTTQDAGADATVSPSNDPKVGHASDAPIDPKTQAATDAAVKQASTTPPPATTTPPPAGTNAPVAVKTEADLAKEANTRGYAVYAVSAPNGQGWNTAATPYLLAPSVDAAGKVDAAKPFNVVFCNYAQGAMTIHSGTGNGPMAHGKAFNGTGLGAFTNLAAAQADLDTKAKTMNMAALLAGNANCQANLISNTATAAGATYNHQGGAANNQASFIFFKMYTADPNGVIAAK